MSQPSHKPAAGEVLPTLTFTKIDGTTTDVGPATGKWMLFVVYRGKHCGRCKKYLNTLEAMQQQWHDAGFDILAVSADPLEKVQADIKEFGWSFDIAYGMSENDMQQLGVYISDPLTPEETDRRFAEPAVFCLRPDGTVQIAALSNGPSARPDLAELLDGMQFTIEHGKPARGLVNA